MALKNLNWQEQMRLYTKLFDCHVLGNPPCNKGGSPVKILVRFLFYILGLIDGIKTMIISQWDDGQIYSKNDMNAHSLQSNKSLESIS